MEYKKIIKDNYEIYYYKTNKFKSINITTILVDDFNKDNITLDNFISNYLLQTNNNYKDEISISKKFLDLYSPKYYIYDTYRDYHYKFFDFSFLSERYTEKGNNKKSVDFYFDIMFNPHIDKDRFDEENFSIIIDEMKSEYRFMDESASLKAFNGALKLISEDLAIKYDSNGNKKDLKFINSKDAYNYYLNELNNSKFIVFLAGEIDDELLNLVSNKLDKKVKRRDLNIRPYLDVHPVKKVKHKEVKTNYDESIIFLVYKIPNMTKREREIVLPVFNNILGGSSSKLFNNVREKHSLAYYVRSNYFGAFNYLFINAGIDSKNYDKALKLIFKEVDNMKNGNIESKEINGSIKSVESSLILKEDNYQRIINDMVLNLLFDKLSNEEILNEIKTVTKKEIIDLASKIELDVNFFLRGETHE